VATVVKFARLFGSKNVFLDLQATVKDEALPEIVRQLEENEVFTAKEASSALRALREREKLGSTGIGNGVAIPHAKTKGVKEMVVALARSKEGIEFQSIDGEPVQLVFLIVSPAAEQEQHLDMLRWMSKLGRNSDFRMFFARARNVREVQGLLREMGDE